MQNIITGESGNFFVDDNGTCYRFEPAPSNPFIEESTKIIRNYYYETNRTIKTFIVPEGVKGFASDFMRGIRVSERFVLPAGLLYIGTCGTGTGSCVFANCILPAVTFPESVQTLGDYAFGHSYIEDLQLNENLRSPYGRQFKDSYIGCLHLPASLKNDIEISGQGKELYLRPSDQHSDNGYDFLRWHSTLISHIDFI